MDDLLKELIEDIDADAATSAPASNLESVIESVDWSDYEDQPDDERATHRHTDTLLTDDAIKIDTIDALLDDNQLNRISDEIVTEHIDEILLPLIAVHDGACGKKLLQDIRRVFGTDLSPGTVYPHLTQLADDGILEMKKLSKRKVYTLADPDAALAQADHVVDQLLLFSFVLKTVLTDCNGNRSQSHRSETNE